jgi:imidazolonepropionase-like amidohydrolase
MAAGSDTPNPLMVPGFSLLEEIRALEGAGLSRFAALRAATRDAAELLGGLEEFGTLTVGKRADLVLLEANPLDRLEALQSPAGVMVRGRWLPRDTLRAMLQGARRR